MKKIKSVVIFYNSKTRKAMTFAQRVQKELERHRINVYKVCVNESACDFHRADAAVTVGGDGTVLYAARHVIGHGIPILGINAGGLGFLSGIERSEFAKHIKLFMNDGLRRVKRRLLSVEVRRGGKKVYGPYPALNDCVIRSHETRAFTLRAYYGREFLSEYFGDGLIISTPTGSTAYNLAALGPIVLPELEVFLLAPVCPHTLTHRPVVLSSAQEMRITLSGGRDGMHRIALSLDGQENVELSAEDEIIVRKHPRDLEMLVPENFSYFDILRKKLSWGER